MHIMWSLLLMASCCLVQGTQPQPGPTEELPDPDVVITPETPTPDVTGAEHACKCAFKACCQYPKVPEGQTAIATCGITAEHCDKAVCAKDCENNAIKQHPLNGWTAERDFKKIAYFRLDSWKRSNFTVDPSHIDALNYTHTHFGPLGYNATLGIATKSSWENWDQLFVEWKGVKAKRIISIGPGVSGENMGWFPLILNGSITTDHTTLIGNIVSFLELHQLDGVDLASPYAGFNMVEVNKQKSSVDPQSFVSFVKDLRLALDRSQNKTLSVTLPSNYKHMENMAITEFVDKVDYFPIATWDLHGDYGKDVLADYGKDSDIPRNGCTETDSRGPCLRSHVNTTETDWLLNTISIVVPPHKMIPGLGMYGRAYERFDAGSECIVNGTAANCQSETRLQTQFLWGSYTEFPGYWPGGEAEYMLSEEGRNDTTLYRVDPDLTKEDAGSMSVFFGGSQEPQYMSYMNDTQRANLSTSYRNRGLGGTIDYSFDLSPAAFNYSSSWIDPAAPCRLPTSRPSNDTAPLCGLRPHTLQCTEEQRTAIANAWYVTSKFASAMSEWLPGNYYQPAMTTYLGENTTDINRNWPLPDGGPEIFKIRRLWDLHFNTWPQRKNVGFFIHCVPGFTLDVHENSTAPGNSTGPLSEVDSVKTMTTHGLYRTSHHIALPPSFLITLKNTLPSLLGPTTANPKPHLSPFPAHAVQLLAAQVGFHYTSRMEKETLDLSNISRALDIASQDYVMPSQETVRGDLRGGVRLSAINWGLAGWATWVMGTYNLTRAPVPTQEDIDGSGGVETDSAEKRRRTARLGRRDGEEQVIQGYVLPDFDTVASSDWLWEDRGIVGARPLPDVERRVVEMFEKGVQKAVETKTSSRTGGTRTGGTATRTRGATSRVEGTAVETEVGSEDVVVSTSSRRTSSPSTRASRTTPSTTQPPQPSSAAPAESRAATSIPVEDWFN